MEFEDSYSILVNIFQILDAIGVQVKQIMQCSAILLQKSENDIAKHYKKKNRFVKKTKLYLIKTQNTLRKYIQISQEEEKHLEMWMFSVKI